MKTSYFGNKEASADPNAVSIARWPPRWWGSRRRYIALAPSADLLKRSKAGGLSWPEYVTEYKRYVLAKLEPENVFSDLGPDSILLCWERPDEDCHRHLVAEWLETSLNVKILEL